MTIQYLTVKESLGRLREIPLSNCNDEGIKFIIKFSYSDSRNSIYDKYDDYRIEIKIDNKSEDFQIDDIIFSRYGVREVRENKQYTSSSWYNTYYHYYFTLEYKYKDQVHSIRLETLNESSEGESIVLALILISILKTESEVRDLWNLLRGGHSANVGTHLNQVIRLSEVGKKISEQYPYFKELFNGTLNSQISDLKERLKSISLLS